MLAWVFSMQGGRLARSAEQTGSGCECVALLTTTIHSDISA